MYTISLGCRQSDRKNRNFRYDYHEPNLGTTQRTAQFSWNYTGCIQGSKGDKAEKVGCSVGKRPYLCGIWASKHIPSPLGVFEYDNSNIGEGLSCMGYS